MRTWPPSAQETGDLLRDVAHTMPMNSHTSPIHSMLSLPVESSFRRSAFSRSPNLAFPLLVLYRGIKSSNSSPDFVLRFYQLLLKRLIFLFQSSQTSFHRCVGLLPFPYSRIVGARYGDSRLRNYDDRLGSVFRTSFPPYGDLPCSLNSV